MSEEWLRFLYPLGFISSVAFTLRFLIQWINSERAQKSVVNSLFWQISLFGNMTLLLHAFIQLQFHVCLVQVCNAVISWRNLNLMQSSEERWKFSSVIYLLVISAGFLTAAFALQNAFLGTSQWFRIPTTALGSANQVSFVWHVIGTSGLILFNSRFWVQWWSAERKGVSYLGPAFWWITLMGTALCSIYFLKIGDIVNLIGPVFGVVPAIRNLMIIYKEGIDAGYTK